MIETMILINIFSFQEEIEQTIIIQDKKTQLSDLK